MTLTLDQYKALWAADNPQMEGESQADYDVRVTDFGTLYMQRSVRDDVAEQKETVKQQFIAGMATLRSDLAVVNNAIAANTPLSAAQIRVGLRDILTSLIWIGDRIADGTIQTIQ